MQTVLAKVKPRMMTKGWRALPSQPLPKLWLGGSFLFAVLAIGSAAITLMTNAESGYTFIAGAGGLILLVSVTVLSVKPRQLTSAGAEMEEYIKGLKVYLELAEKDRFAMLQSVTGADRVPFIPENAAGLVNTADRVDASDPRAVVKLYENSSRTLCCGTSRRAGQRRSLFTMNS